MKLKALAVAAVLMALTSLSSTASAQPARPVVDRADLDQALGEKVNSDESARDSIRALLGREDVQAMAQGAGLDVRRAVTAVSTLEGADLQRVASQANTANDLLAGGATTLHISLVVILLIVIIIILVA